MTTRCSPKSPPWFVLCAISLCATACFDASPLASIDDETDAASATDGDTDGPVFTSGSSVGPSSGPSTTLTTTTDTASSTSPTTTTSPSTTGSSTTGSSTTDSSTTDSSETGDSGSTDESGGSGSTDESGGSGSTDEGGDSTSTGPACANDESCIAAAPGAWLGPAVVYEGNDAAPDCPAAFPTAVLDAFAGVTAPPADCDCSCGDATGLSCGAATLIERGNDCISFVMNPLSYDIPPGVCVPISGTNDTAWFVEEGELDVSGASCTPSASETIIPSQSNGQIRACIPAAAEACDEDGVCLGSDDEFDRTCIYREGTHACPGGGFDQQQIIYTSVTDDRACTSCGCGTPSGSCGGTFFSTTNNCTIVNGSVSAQACGTLGQVPSQGSYSPSPDGSCAPTGGAPTGDATPTGEFTLCCDA